MSTTTFQQSITDNTAKTKQHTLAANPADINPTSIFDAPLNGEDSPINATPAQEREQQQVTADGKQPTTNPNLINGRSKGKIALIMLALCLAVFLGALDVTIVTTALPTISDHFQSSAGYTWIGSAFLLANA